MGHWSILWALAIGHALHARAAVCPGQITVEGHGTASLVPTGWANPSGPVPVDVVDGRMLVPHQGARAYFADTCIAGTYSNEQYSAMNLLGKTFKFTTDLTGAGCGCNAALYLVSMHQNTQISTCGDYYCDANDVCGVSCAEIDIMEANQFAWHSTLHTAHDHNGAGSGYGGGDDYDGPRDWTTSMYAPGATCIDTAQPFDVAVSFPVDAEGILTAMEVVLTQSGKSCPLKAVVKDYPGMKELTAALKAGMTPVVSYWSSSDMLWMDGKGKDGKGPCISDNADACSPSVKFYDFKLEDMAPDANTQMVVPVTGGGMPSSGLAPSSGFLPPTQTLAPLMPFMPVATLAPLAPAAGSADSCPGTIQMLGKGDITLIPTGWLTDDGPIPIDVPDEKTIVTHMGARGYFADTCTAGQYSNEQYMAMNLLGKTLKFKTDLTGAGCGCNAAFYLVSMHQNTRPSECKDYYCDANNVCGESCSEIDIMEANQYAWHSTLHTSQDHNGLGSGYGGGDSFNGPRDFSGSQYGPGGSCVDTSMPFEVAVSFPVDGAGTLTAMEVTLTQEGKSCPLNARVANYPGMPELTNALKAGMTPVFSYWSSDNMLWMDGKGADGQGPCVADNKAACGKTVKFYDFSLADIGGQPPSGSADPLMQTPAATSPIGGLLVATTTEEPQSPATCPGDISVGGHGTVSIVPTGWIPDNSGSPMDVPDSRTVAPTMGARGYFAESCTAGQYSNEQYSALNLLGKTIKFKTDLTGAGCGCNAAFYLVSMRQNTKKSECHDYYCDANNVCGESCAEIDIMEANQFAWHSTLHTWQDHNGLGGGYGGGDTFNGPRDFGGAQYAPGGSCVDTNKPFDVAVSFPVDGSGTLTAMEVSLTQEGKSCPLNVRVANYPGMGELSAALKAGMTPVISYWASNNMLWMDGKGADGQGPCATDNKGACGDKVQFFDFSIETIGGGSVSAPDQTPTQAPAATPATTVAPAASAATCPGDVDFPGHGTVSIVPTGWLPDNGGAAMSVSGHNTVTPHMGARGYFAETCTAGKYSNEQYTALNLLGKTLRFTTDLTGAGCGCNAAFYLVSMHQNTQVSECYDYYCDANNVCGESCAEIDIMEANQFAWHSTLHTSQDHNGLGGGYGGGDSFNGPRDFMGSQFMPGGSCIDTNRPFQVEVSFPVDGAGTLSAMEVSLTQEGKSCPLNIRVANYPGMGELTNALKAGMTPVISYWSSNSMLWMDGKGADGQGPCATDNKGACGKSVEFSDFSVRTIGSPVPTAATTTKADPWGLAATSTAAPSTDDNAESVFKGLFFAGQDEGAKCPGTIYLEGHGQVSLVPTGWQTPEGAVPIGVSNQNLLTPQMGTRAYFADTCSAGTYDPSQYLALKLLRKTIHFTVDLTGAGCGCNVAVYLVSMRQNTLPSECHDYYCDANEICGVPCTEIDLMEANQFAWHSTLHTSKDHNGLGGGYGGGDGFDGPRDWNSKYYAPGGSCIDTSMPFDVAVSFPVDTAGSLAAMQVVLTQEGKSCPLTASVTGYSGMAQISAALEAGMTPVVSYWSSDQMLWLDGKGSDLQGPCNSDSAGTCSDSVKISNFAIDSLGEPGASATPTAAPVATQAPLQPATTQPLFPVTPAPLTTPAPPTTLPVSASTCPGRMDFPGHGPVQIIPTGWNTPKGGAKFEVADGKTLLPHMGARAYFAEECTAGTYDHNQYTALNLLGKTLKFSVDLAGAGCGCNAAFYLVSMRQNTQVSECHDYYCDANNVCGESCAEIDIMEANQFAWHSTLHTSQDHNGVGSGFGGGDTYNGPRDFTGAQFAPGGSCIDTAKPFHVAVTFPVDGSGNLQAMKVTLTQEGKSCPLAANVDSYAGMGELTNALKAGMTPVVSYWSSDQMLWMDGKGADGMGPCASDNSGACSEAVKMYDFSLEGATGPSPPTTPAAPPATPATPPPPPPAQPTPAPPVVPAGGGGSLCPGEVDLKGHGTVSVIPNGWKSPGGFKKVDVLDGNKLVPHMGSRAYLADTCTGGTYDNNQYMALNLLGKTLRFTVDLTGAGCGCNAAFYLVSMHQNTEVSECQDYYCDANKVCGVSCAEIDIMEANQFAWHSTLHTAHDHNGVGGGYGGGDSYDGPRDWNSLQYAPGAQCIDTAKPFEVSVSFPTNPQGQLSSMDVTLSQSGHSCKVNANVGNYPGMAELTQALTAGMTPVISYWSSDAMLWMDGKGADGQGPCVSDQASSCGDTVKMYDFVVEDIGGAPPAEVPAPGGLPPAPVTPAPTLPPAPPTPRCPGNIDVAGQGSVSIIPTGWKTPKGGAAFDVQNAILQPHMGARAYFGDTCTAGTYDNNQYMALNLLGKAIEFTADLTGAGCGCNVAFYLVSMHQNTKVSDCHDYYCDANNVCGESCAEIDIMEANQFAWHSTLHSSTDHNGVGGGYGGGDGYDGPRDWSAAQYAPGASCIDTAKPFSVRAEFPVDGAGTMKAMKVILSQPGKSCTVSANIGSYAGMQELTAALAAGMTPVVSYWSSDDMLWMDGKGKDNQGPCASDNSKACSETVKLYGFSVKSLGEASTPGIVTPAPAATTTQGSLYFAGQGDAAVSSSSGEDIFEEAATLLEKAAAAAATTKAPHPEVSFDCEAGKANWQWGWSDMKKAACCKKVGIPCPVVSPNAPAAPAVAPGMPVAPMAPVAPAVPSPGGCATAFQQCGGQNWIGAQCCEDGCTCESHGDYYSQCSPIGGSGTCAASAASAAGELTFMRKHSNRGPLKGLGASTSLSTRWWLALGGMLAVSGAVAAATITAMRATVRQRAEATRQAEGNSRGSRRYEAIPRLSAALTAPSDIA